MKLTPDLLIKAYAIGVFPMAESASDPNLHWIDPDERGVLPLDQFHLPRSLKRTLRKQPFRVSINENFGGTMRACAATREARPETWINPQILSLYDALYERGMAHSVECWHQTSHGEKFAGGLYGVALGGAFFGESMVSFATDASKIALCYLVARLRVGGFTLLDTQFVTEHLARFGTIEISRSAYQLQLERALATPADFYRLSPSADVETILQSITHTS
ncbi:MAG: leucyl/phenylalanyl-tRNA--protein transferase [Alphaproteobacteria bacterium]